MIHIVFIILAWILIFWLNTKRNHMVKICEGKHTWDHLIIENNDIMYCNKCGLKPGGHQMDLNMVNDYKKRTGQS